MYKFPIILEQIERKRRFYLRAAFTLIIFINVIRWNGWEPFDLWENWITKPQTYIFIALINLNAWAWVLTSLGYGKKYLNKKSNLLSYMLFKHQIILHLNMFFYFLFVLQSVFFYITYLFVLIM